MASSFLACSPTENPYRLNAGEYESRLHNNANLLFSATDSTTKVIHCHEDHTRDLTSLSKIEEYFQTYPNFSGTRIIMIYQRNSWGRLMISEDEFSRLLGGLGVFGEFAELVQAFGTKTSAVDETFASRPIFQGDTSGSFRLSYLIKHVEANKKEQTVDPYSVRQMAVYHGYDAPNEGHTFVLVNPSITFQKHWKQAKEKSDPRRGMGWMDLHVAVAYAMTCGWRKYVNYLESEFDRTQTKSFGDANFHFSQARMITGLSQKRSPQKPVAALDRVAVSTTELTNIREYVTFEDIQSLQILKDRVLLLEHVLLLNLGVFEALKERLVTLEAAGLALTGCAGKPQDEVANIFSRYLSDTVVAGHRVDHLLKRIEGASNLLRTILDFRALETARYDNEIMLDLSKKAHQDGRTLKTITLLTLVYLPATFVATLLSMGYIRFTSKNGHIVLELSSELWIFTLLTAVLLAITMGYRKYWECRQRSKARKQEEERGMCDLA